MGVLLGSFPSRPWRLKYIFPFTIARLSTAPIFTRLGLRVVSTQISPCYNLLMLPRKSPHLTIT